MDNYSELFKLLSDDTRLRIIHLLHYQDLCVCELVELLDESQPKISKHIAKIRSNKLVKTERNEQFIYYSLDKANYINVLDPILRELKGKEPYQSDYHNLQSKSSFVCTGGNK